MKIIQSCLSSLQLPAATGKNPGQQRAHVVPYMKLTRRTACGWFAAAAARSLLAKANHFQLAICNETYDPMGFADGCRAIKKAGYDGVEIAPPTLSEDPAVLPASRRAEFRNIRRSEGLRYVGLHLLLTVPKGLPVTTPDAAV